MITVLVDHQMDFYAGFRLDYTIRRIYFFGIHIYTQKVRLP